MEVIGQLNTMVPLHPGIVLPYLFSRKMFGTNRFSGWFGEGKNDFSLLGFDPRFFGCRALNLDTIRPRHSCSCWRWLWKRVQSVKLFALKSLLLQRIGFQAYCYLNFTVEKTCSSSVKVNPAVSAVWGYNSSAYTVLPYHWRLSWPGMAMVAPRNILCIMVWNLSLPFVLGLHGDCLFVL